MNDSDFLAQAIELAKKSIEEVGCGAVIVQNGKAVAAAFNSQKTDNIAVNHAEVKSITMANQELGNRTLQNSTAYCSCEPCVMCLAALSYAKVGRIVFNKTLLELFPDDPQSKIDSYKFVSQLNFVPRLEQLSIND